MESKRVAVIGAGPSGLVAVKELLDLGHRPVCFEKAGSKGGVFRFGERDGVVWESCRLTSSSLITAFSDFPVSPARSEHMSIGEYVEYLSEYCAAFDVDRHIRYGADVQAVTRAAEGGWNLQWTDGCASFKDHFDSVAVCSGLHQNPHIPEFPGKESYTGEILHSAQYRRPGQVAGKKVLIVGVGESGADVAAEVADRAAETVLSISRGAAVVPRRAFGMPRDYLTSRLMNSTSHWVFQTRHPADNRKRTVYRYTFLPLVLIDKCLLLLQRLFWEILPLCWPPRFAEIRLKLRKRKLIRQLLEESGGTENEQFGTKDDRFVMALASGKCRRVSAIQSFAGRRVVFEKGGSFEPDLVLLCTGFETQLPFIDEGLRTAGRYLHTFIPEAGASLGFIGFLRPAFGAIPPLAELQARWFALVQSDLRSLPPRARMEESIAHWRAFHRRVFRPVGERLGHLVDFTVFSDELATQVGCKPLRRQLRRENRSFRWRFHAGPFVAAQYRLVGPNAKPDQAREVIESLPVAHPPPQLVYLYMRWTLCRILYRLLGREYAPKLMLE